MFNTTFIDKYTNVSIYLRNKLVCACIYHKSIDTSQNEYMVCIINYELNTVTSKYIFKTLQQKFTQNRQILSEMEQLEDGTLSENGLSL